MANSRAVSDKSESVLPAATLCGTHHNTTKHNTYMRIVPFLRRIRPIRVTSRIIESPFLNSATGKRAKHIRRMACRITLSHHATSVTSSSVAPAARRGLNQLLFAFAEYCAKKNGLVLADMILILHSQNNSGAARNFSLMGDLSSLSLGKLLDWYLPDTYLQRPPIGRALTSGASAEYGDGPLSGESAQ